MEELTNILKENEVLDDLQLNNLFIIQNKKDYCFTSDSVLLSNFVKVGYKDNVVEFCSGSGVISILVNEKYKPKSIVGFEIQPQLCDMSNRTLKYNNINNVKFLNDNLSNAINFVGNEKTDVLICNPPYFTCSNMNEQTKEKFKITKYELCTNLEEIFISAQKILKFGGKFFLIHISSRVQEILYLAQKYNFFCKEMQVVYPNKNKISHLTMFYFTKKGKPECKILSPIVLN